MKDAIRKQILRIRNGLSEKDVSLLSEKTFYNLKENSFFNNSTHVMIYLDFKNEIKTDPIINYCLKNNKKVYVPICISETHELCTSRITSLEELQSGHFGIREPGLQYIRLSDSKLIDLVLVPGVAFDVSGNRIGFGAGYYDRFMMRLKPGAIKAALAYSFQIVDTLPSDEYDIPMDYIVTEKCTIDCTDNYKQR
ncbi:MAG: 5-formyltetrahydrofolate cyclo-ligase [Clostridiaceae bacterium]|nr:5-formyltetrahydrofolate cyclo-ligase [Clostridiaceae bacterium]